MAERLGVESRLGVVVTKVNHGSPAAEAGLAPGDIISEIDRKPVADVAQYRKIVDNLKTGDDVLLYIIRGGHSMFQVVTLAGDDEK